MRTKTTTKPATIRDVARDSGVSIATVSYVINDGPRRVDPATRAKVMAAQERLQYHPSTMARGLNRKRLNCLGVVFPMAIPSLVSDSYFSAILDGITHVATEREQNVVLSTSANAYEMVHRDVMACASDETGAPAFEPTSDDANCLAGWRCKQRNSDSQSK